MLFTDFFFIFLFLPITFIVYFLFCRLYPSFSNLFLTLASLFFYGYWNSVYIILILISISFNFFISMFILKTVHKRLFLTIAVTSNVLLLVYYKYMDFFISNINVIFSFDLELLNIILPLGISFFTFTQIAYLVDCYKGYVKEYNYINYALFVSYFPHLLAGPILHHKEMIPQFLDKENKKINLDNFSIGFYLFSLGLFKKLVIADTCGSFADFGFSNIGTLDTLSAWFSSLFYTFQLYFDFSAYTDMAIGISLFFNVKLPINFNSPYKALDIQDFWRRWHITLSRFLRDYIYIPLGGNRLNISRTYANLIIVFFIGGLWHGAGWGFVIWGLLHGIASVIHRIWKNYFSPLPKIIAWFITFNFVNIAWIFFRANNVNDAMQIIKLMFSFSGFEIVSPFFMEYYHFDFKYFGIFFSVLCLSVLFYSILKLQNSISMVFKTKFTLKDYFIAISCLILAFLYCNKATNPPFLYFNF